MPLPRGSTSLPSSPRGNLCDQFHNFLNPLFKPYSQAQFFCRSLYLSPFFRPSRRFEFIGSAPVCLSFIPYPFNRTSRRRRRDSHSSFIHSRRWCMAKDLSPSRTLPPFENSRNVECASDTPTGSDVRSVRDQEKDCAVVVRNDHVLRTLKT